MKMCLSQLLLLNCSLGLFDVLTAAGCVRSQSWCLFSSLEAKFEGKISSIVGEEGNAAHGTFLL